MIKDATIPQIETAPPADTAPGQTVPVHSAHADSPDWFSQQRDRIFKFFAESPEHAGEFQAWQEKQEARARIEGMFRSLTSNIEAAKLALATLIAQVEAAVGCDLARSIYSFVQANGADKLQIIARDPFIASTAILKDCGAKVVQLSKADLAALEKEFDRFKSENKSVLRELNLL
jgi:hypothetical protein